MESFFIVLLCFSFSLILHIVAHRIIRLRSIGVYLAGAVLLYGFGRMGSIALPWSSGFLYILLSATVILFYLAISLGTEIPSSIILQSFQRKKHQTLNELAALFTNKGLIRERLDDLIQSAMVSRREGVLTLTLRGRVLWRIMEIYRWVFHRPRTE